MALFKLGEAFKELTSATGSKDTAISGAKLVGKIVFNVGKIAFDEMVKHTEKTSGTMLKRNDLTDEQSERLNEIHESSKNLRIEREIKDKQSFVEAEIKAVIKRIDSKLKENEEVLDADNISAKEREKVEISIQSLNHLKEGFDIKKDEIDEDSSKEDPINTIKKMSYLVSELEEKLDRIC
jgi:vacuolar-type H+-ATPase subunit I/STV1